MAGKKQNYNKSGALSRHKQQLREDAEYRRKERSKRTNEEQLVLLDTRRGNSTTERARLS